MENKLNFRKRTRRSIANVVNLLAALDVTESELTEFKLLRDEDKYSAKEVVKSDGSIRTVYAPHPLVRKLQRRINRRIFSIEQSGRWISKNRRKGSIIWPSYLYGSVPNDQYDNIVVSKDYVA